MKKALCFLIILFNLTMLINAKKLAKLTDILEAAYITVSNDKIFISGDNSIHIYSSKDMKLIKKIGRKGNGPEEFQYSPKIRIYNEKLYAYSLNKLSIIDTNGKFLTENRLKGFWNFKIAPIKDNFVLLHFSMMKKNKKIKNALVVSLCNNKIEEIKTLYSSPENSGKKINIVPETIDFDIWNNKIFIADSHKGLYIIVLNDKGEKLKEFKNPYKKIKISESYKKERIDKFKKNMPKGIKFNISCPDYFPPFHKFYIFDGHLYFKTYEKKGDKILFRIFDTKGKELKKIYLPDQNIFTFNNNSYYYLKRDENDDWELYSVKI